MQFKNIINKCFVLSLAAVLLAACGGKDVSDDKDRLARLARQSVSVDPALRQRLTGFVSAPRVKGQFGFYVYDLTADRPVYGFNERKALPTASCMKLLSGVAGLHLLGTGYRYTTELYIRGRVAAGTLLGDVTFKAGLDPQLNGPDLKVFPEQLRKRGIRRLKGRLVVDLALQEPVKSEAHWYPWDLSFSRYGLLFKGSDRIVKELKASFRAHGVSVADSQVVVGTMPEGSRCVLRCHRIIDPVIKRMWKNSSNTQATSLLYTIGRRVEPQAEPAEAGMRYLRKFLREELKQTDTALVVHDGCGLCVHNQLSPEALTAVLRYGYARPDIYRKLRQHLSVAGVDGTLAREMSSAKTRGRIYAKTGTLSHPYGISSLAGYCEGSNGHVLAFCILDTEMSVLDARVLQRRLCELLVAE